MLGQQMRAQQEQQAQVEAQERQKILQHERQLMIDSNPSWADEAKMKSDLSEIVEYAGRLADSRTRSCRTSSTADTSMF